MTKPIQEFGNMAKIYVICGGGLEAHITDLGATLHRLYVPDNRGVMQDVVLGYATPEAYIAGGTFFGAVIGRNSNRLKDGQFCLNGKTYQMDRNDNGNNLHSGQDYFKNRLWTVESYEENSICLSLQSPNGDQGFPGNATIRATYTLEEGGVLRLTYDAVCDEDTVFNLTNHSYFNLAGHNHPEQAMQMELQLAADAFTPSDAKFIPTGEVRAVEGTPMDFRTPKAIGRDVALDHETIKLQNGYDHNFVLSDQEFAVLYHAGTGITMKGVTDLPGVQFYSGNFLKGDAGKDGVSYCFRSGICLETQYFPDALNQPRWQQPVTKAGQPYHSETKFIFSV